MKWTIMLPDFPLLWCGRRDGFGGVDFHRYCDRQSRTVTVIPLVNWTVFGGFAALRSKTRDD
jgi:hypothetical protein